MFEGAGLSIAGPGGTIRKTTGHLLQQGCLRWSRPAIGKGSYMTQPTPYQYAKLGSNLEFLRGICTVSLMQTTSLAAFPNLMANLPAQRYSVLRVVEGLKAVLIQLQEMELQQSLQAAEPFRPMLKEMEDYLACASHLSRLT